MTTLTASPEAGRPRRIRRMVMLGLLPVIGLVGCGDGDDSSSPSTTTEPAAEAAEVKVTGQWARTSPSGVTRGPRT
ncbi:MAG: hypothetical protein R2698_08935 [Microthrixaceae bacterium]